MQFEHEIIEDVMDEPIGLSVARIHSHLPQLPLADFLLLVQGMAGSRKIRLVDSKGLPLEQWKVAEFFRAGSTNEDVRITATPFGLKYVYGGE